VLTDWAGGQFGGDVVEFFVAGWDTLCHFSLEWVYTYAGLLMVGYEGIRAIKVQGMVMV